MNPSLNNESLLYVSKTYEKLKKAETILHDLFWDIFVVLEDEKDENWNNKVTD